MKRMLLSSAFVFALQAASADTAVWSGAADASWHTAENWDIGVPGAFTTANVGTTSGDGIEITSSAVCSNLWLTTTGGNGKTSTLHISADLAVDNEFIAAYGNSSECTVEQTAGIVAIGKQLYLGNSSGNECSYELSGAGTVLTVPTVSMTRYKASGLNDLAIGRLTVRDGATLNVTTKLNVAGQGYVSEKQPASEGTLEVLDGAVATVKDLYYSAGGVGTVVVSNATLTVTGTASSSPTRNENQPPTKILVYDGGVLTVNSFVVGLYTSCNEFIEQHPGSRVECSSLKLAGAGQGGAGTDTNEVYRVLGGTLTVTGDTTIGNNGQARMELEGGTVAMKNVYLDALNDVTKTVVSTNELDVVETNTVVTTVYEPSVLRFAGDSDTTVTGTLYLHGKYRGARIALETEGGAFHANIQKIDTITPNSAHVKTSLITKVAPDGLAALEVVGDVKLRYPLVVAPEALEGARYGKYTILQWGGSLTLSGDTAGIVLSDEVDPLLWGLIVDAANKKVVLNYRQPATLIQVL